MLLALQFFGNRASPCTAPHVHDAHHLRIVVNDEEYAVHVRLPAIAQDAHGLVRIDALRRDRTALRMLSEREDRALEAVEPLGALLRRSTDDPQIQLFELGLRVLRDVNAVCHACGAADRTPAARVS